MSSKLNTAYHSFNKLLKHLPVEKSLPKMLLRVTELTEEILTHRQISILLFDNYKKLTPFTNKSHYQTYCERFIVNPTRI